MLVQILMPARGVSELMKVLLHSGNYLQRINLNNGRNNFAARSTGPAFFLIPHESIYQAAFSSLQISTREVIIPVNYSLSTKLIKNKMLPFFKIKTNTLLFKTYSVYEVNVFFFIVEAC